MDVSEQHKNRRLWDFEALKSWKMFGQAQVHQQQLDHCSGREEKKDLMIETHRFTGLLKTRRKVFSLLEKPSLSLTNLTFRKDTLVF